MLLISVTRTICNITDNLNMILNIRLADKSWFSLTHKLSSNIPCLLDVNKYWWLDFSRFTNMSRIISAKYWIIFSSWWAILQILLFSNLGIAIKYIIYFLYQCPLSLKRHHDHGISYTKTNLIGVCLHLEVYSIIITVGSMVAHRQTWYWQGSWVFIIQFVKHQSH